MNAIPEATWLEFLSLVTDTRAIQTLYARTLDPVARREKERLELRVDATIETFTAFLAAGQLAAAGEVGEYKAAREKLLASAAKLFAIAPLTVEGGAE